MAAQPNQYRMTSWRKSSASVGYTDCVEVACSGPVVLVRDSDRKLGAILRFTADQWRGFLRDIKRGDTGPG
jgi:hypothetical protein